MVTELKKIKSRLYFAHQKISQLHSLFPYPINSLVKTRKSSKMQNRKLSLPINILLVSSPILHPHKTRSGKARRPARRGVIARRANSALERRGLPVDFGASLAEPQGRAFARCLRPWSIYNRFDRCSSSWAAAP